MNKENISLENQTRRSSPNLSNDDKSLQLQEEFEMEMSLEEPIMQIPVIKSVSCTGTTQTNTRLCGLVESSDLGDEFRFNCFYCCEVFPLEKWKEFLNHLKSNHSNMEDHDYTPAYISPSTTAVSIKNESIYPTLLDPLGTACKPFETVILNTSPCYGTDKAEIDFNQRISNYKQPLFSHFLKTKNITEEHIEEQEKLKSDSIQLVKQTPTEISFEYTRREIVNLLLENMKNYPVLWQFNSEPFNVDFYEAVEDLCKIINDKWSLKIDNLRMRRSINRILRFYCHFFPNGNDENNDKFTSYYETCYTFLPSSVNEIAYARCSHCYICFRTGFDLKLHLYEEQKCLKLPFKCVQCKECFIQCDEYEFHKQLPHYDDIFRCLPCNKTFFRRNIYNRHMLEYHPKVCNEPGSYKCNICDKTFYNSYNLKGHKLIHGEKKYRCHLCSQSFLLNSRLILHLKTHRKELDIKEYHPKVCNEPGAYKCNICDKTFNNSSNLKGHKLIHGEKPYRCHLCPKSFLLNSRLMLHLKTHRKEYDLICEVCGKGFHRQSNLRTHMKKHTGEKVTCNICNLKLRKSSLSRHLRIVHVALEGVVDETKRRHLFYKRLIRSRPMLPLVKKCGYERNYYCKFCKINFENYKLIVEHNKEFHSDIPKWPCKLCITEFSHKLNLKRHYRRKHDLNVIQVYKLVDENEDLNVVLSLEKEEFDKLAETLIIPKNKQSNASKSSTTKTPMKPHSLSEDVFFEVERLHSSTIEDEIMKAADNNEAPEAENDNLSDFFTELSQEHHKNI